MKKSQYFLKDEEMKDLILKMETKVFDLNDLNPAKYNPRFIDQEALDGLDESLSSFGYIQPIIVNTRDGANTIVGGHQRYKILKKKGVEKAECVTVDVDEITEKTMNVSLNNPEISGKWDLNKLEELTAEIRNEIPNFEELKLALLESNLEINIDEFGDFDEEDEEDEEESYTKDKLYTVEIEFLPEDYEMFVDLMDSIEIDFKSPSKKVQFGLKLAQYIKNHESPDSM